MHACFHQLAAACLLSAFFDECSLSCVSVLFLWLDVGISHILWLDVGISHMWS